MLPGRGMTRRTHAHKVHLGVDHMVKKGGCAEGAERDNIHQRHCLSKGRFARLCKTTEHLEFKPSSSNCLVQLFLNLNTLTHDAPFRIRDSALECARQVAVEERPVKAMDDSDFGFPAARISFAGGESPL